MCLAIYKPKGKVVRRGWLHNGYDFNPDGAGFAWTDGTTVHIEKGFFTYESFWEAYKPHIKDACVIHFRQATHGNVGVFNCHPWPLVDGKYALIHNGILNIQSDKEVSDTGNFVNLVLDPAVRAMGLEHPALLYLVELAVGMSNKIAILKPDGNALLINEKQGFWVNGIWFSNQSYSDTYGQFYCHPWDSKKAATGRNYGMGDWERSGGWPEDEEIRDYVNQAPYDEREDEERYYKSLGFSDKAARDLADIQAKKIG